MDQFKLELLSFEVVKVLFERSSLDKELEYNIDVQLGINDMPNEEELDIFTTSFHVTLSSIQEQDSAKIEIHALGLFQIHGNPPENIIYNFKHISSPSIVYPYIRAFISNLSLQSGLNPVITPTINFIPKKEE